MAQIKTVMKKPPLKLLIVDDSWVLRRVLRGTLSQRDDIEIVGEATNGVEALDLILKLGPDVILLDVEMPIMDGMTTLQHLMIHTPTPVIMLSSLSQWGSARCFDALKYGAIDFVSKNSFFKGIDGTAHSKLVIGKVLAAADMKVSTIDPMQLKTCSNESKTIEQVVFCEECGTRNSAGKTSTEARIVHCKKCGDEISMGGDQRYRRMSYLTVIGAGTSGYGNLLKIIPELTPDMGGAIFVMISDSMEYVKSFAQYLDSISDFQVAFGENGAAVEGGCCYIFSGEQHVTLSPYSGAYSLQIKRNEDESDYKPIDTLMHSVASLLGERALGALLSGDISDGGLGISEIIEKNGYGLVLNPSHCLHKTMVTDPSIRLKLQTDLDEFGLSAQIKKQHFLNKENVVTA
jgi:two-component system, chemotaxis family, protein-glutamate methylesterase/glutaminase